MKKLVAVATGLATVTGAVAVATPAGADGVDDGCAWGYKDVRIMEYKAYDDYTMGSSPCKGYDYGSSALRGTTTAGHKSGGYSYGVGGDTLNIVWKH